MERGGNGAEKKQGEQGSPWQLVLPLVSFIPHLLSVSISTIWSCSWERTASLWGNECVGSLIDTWDEKGKGKESVEVMLYLTLPAPDWCSVVDQTEFYWFTAPDICYFIALWSWSYSQPGELWSMPGMTLCHWICVHPVVNIKHCRLTWQLRVPLQFDITTPRVGFQHTFAKN